VFVSSTPFSSNGNLPSQEQKRREKMGEKIEILEFNRKKRQMNS
jgi:hypothetical protein